MTQRVSGLLKLTGFSVSDILWPFQGEGEDAWSALILVFAQFSLELNFFIWFLLFTYKDIMLPGFTSKQRS